MWDPPSGPQGDYTHIETPRPVDEIDATIQTMIRSPPGKPAPSVAAEGGAWLWGASGAWRDLERSRDM